MALAALEAAGLLDACNRLVRVRWRDPLAMVTRTRVLRTSNCYAFPGEGSKSQAGTLIQPSKGQFPSGTGSQFFNHDLTEALRRLKGAFEKAGGDRMRRETPWVSWARKYSLGRGQDPLDDP